MALMNLKKIKLHHKYLNNLNYYKTIKILNNEKFIDGKFFLMSESKVLLLLSQKFTMNFMRMKKN